MLSHTTKFNTYPNLKHFTSQTRLRNGICQRQGRKT